jgi:hypothetical protein
MKKTALIMMLVASSGFAKAQCKHVTKGYLNYGSTGFNYG